MAATTMSDTFIDRLMNKKDLKETRTAKTVQQKI